MACVDVVSIAPEDRGKFVTQIRPFAVKDEISQKRLGAWLKKAVVARHAKAPDAQTGR
jgi:hypothetical protein